MVAFLGYHVVLQLGGTMNKIDNLEQEGKFVEAQLLREKQKIQAARRNKKNVDGETITTQIVNKLKEDISEILTEYNLPTAIYYIEKTIESDLEKLQKSLKTSIQEVLDKVTQ